MTFVFDDPKASFTEMRDKPLVSVIIIFLNVGDFLREAIESVLAQTYDNWELLLADDGSADSSTDIALQYAAKHPNRIRYLEHPNHENRGMSVARNLGIRNAKGKILRPVGCRRPTAAL